MNNHLKSVPTPITLAAIVAWEFVGNAWSDGPAFKLICEFVEDGIQPICDRASALRRMGKAGMELTDEENQGSLTNEEYVLGYLGEVRDAPG
jgi:hypothetical protein